MLTRIRKAATLGFLATGLTTLRAVLVLPLLAPEQLGVWKSVMLLMPAVGLIRLAISTGMLVRVPYHLGAGQRALASRLVTAAGVVQIGNGLLFAAGAAIAALWIRDPQMRLALFAMAAVLLASQLHNYLRDVILAHRDIDSRSRGLVLAALSDCLFSLGLAAKYGLVGLGIGTVLGFAIPAVYLWRRAPEFAVPRWDPAAWKELWRAGWSSAMADTGTVVLRYVDVAILAFMASPRMIGLYALSQMIVDLSGHLARVSLGEVVGPELAHQSSQATLRQVAASLKRPLVLVAALLPLVLLVGALVMPWAVHLLLPKYAEGIGAARIILIGSLFIAVQAVLQPYLVLAGSAPRLAGLTAALIPVVAVAQVGAYQARFGLEGTAAVATLAMAVLTSATLFWVVQSAGFTRQDALAWLRGFTIRDAFLAFSPKSTLGAK